MGRLFVILIVILLVVSVVSCGKTDEPKEQDALTLGGGKQPTPAPEPAPIQAPPPDTGAGSGIIDVKIEGGGDEGVTPADTPAAVPEGTPAVPLAPAGPGEHTLRIDAEGECWVEVAGPGDEVFKGLMNQGDSKSFGPRKYFLVTIGATDMAMVYYDGKLLYGGSQPSAPNMYFALPAEASVYLKKPEDKPAGETPTVATPTPPPPTPTSSPGGMHTVRVDVADQCWVVIKSGGETIVSRLLEQGDTRTVGPKAGFEIRLGKPEVATVYLDGREIYGPKAGYAKTLSFNLPGDYVAPDAPPEPTAPETTPPVTPPSKPSGEILIEVQPAPAPEPIPTEPVKEPDGEPSAAYRGWIETGMWSLAMQDYEAAIENFGRAYEIEPNYAEVNRLLGKSHRGAGNLDKAISYLNTALRLNPDDTEALLEMAYAYEDKGDTATAIIYFDRYLDLKDDENIKEHVDELRGG